MNTSKVRNTTAIILAVVLALVGCGGGGSLGSSLVMFPPSISNFSAEMTSLPVGQSTVLKWQSTGATSLSLNNGIGSVTGTSATVAPLVTTTYTLTAINASGQATASTTVTVSAASSAGGLDTPFAVSYRANATDAASGLELGGTEFRQLVTHKGRLFGGLEGFNDLTPAGKPPATARIVAKDSAAAPWRIDRSFDEALPAGVSPPPGRPRVRHEGVTALASVSFTNDKNGQALASPVNLLVAGMRDFLKGLSIYVRNDATATWSEVLVESLSTDQSTVRSFGSHRDKVTGADMLFVGGNPGGIYSATYDPVAGLVFKRPAELAYTPASQAVSVRPMAFTECDGDVFSVLAPYVYRRIDGAAPRWEVIYDYSSQFTPSLNGPSGLRGLTCVQSPGGSGKSLIAGFEKPGTVFRLDKKANGWVINTTPEYDTNAALSAATGTAINYTIIANNTFTSLTDPDTGESVHLMTVQIHPALNDDAWYTIRRSNGTHQLRRIVASQLATPISMNSTRTAVVSPFPEEGGTIVYLGGFDVVDIKYHNTAYVVRAGLRTVLGNPVVPQAQSCQTFGVPTVTASGVVSNDILPSTIIGSTQWNAPHVVMTHASAAPTGKLVVFMAGSNGAPGGYRTALAAAARMGHNTIGLTYPNSWTVDQLCSGDSDVNCDRKLRQEIITGQALSPKVNVSFTDSIDNRLATLLNYLRVQQPGKGWDSFLVNGVIQWDKVIVSGHSQGGGHAAMIAKMRAVNRVAMFAAPADYNETLMAPSPWIGEPGLTPTSSFIGFDHQNDPLVRYTPIWAALGLPTFGPIVTVEQSSAPYSCSRQLVTSLAIPSGATATQIHNAVVVDGVTPVANGEATFLPVWSQMFGR